MKLKKKAYGILAAVLLLVTAVFIGTQGLAGSIWQTMEIRKH